MDIEERIKKLKKAFDEGRISKDIYDRNVTQLKKEMEEKGLSGKSMIECPICGAANEKGTDLCSDCGMEMGAKPVEPTGDVDTLLEDIFKRDTMKGEAVDEIDLDDLELPEKTGVQKPQEDHIDDSITDEVETTSTPPKMDADDDEILIDELYDSLVFREDEIQCPLCGTSLPKSSMMCNNCNAQLTEDGELKEEVSMDVLSSSIEDGLAELADLAEGLVSEVETVPGTAEPEVPTEVPVETTEPVVTSELPAEAQPDVSVTEEVESLEERPAEMKPVTVKEVEGDITEEALPHMHLLGMRYVDFVVIGTVVALVMVFALFGMFSWENLTVTSTGIFFGVALAGMVVTFVIFRISTSAIAEGDRLFIKGDYEGALMQYERAIKFSSKPATAWTSKGVTQKRFGDFEGALRSHNIALKLNPKNEIAWCNKGDLLFRLNKYKEALECYDNALDINPRYPIAWNNKGISLARLQKYEEAKKCQDVATRLKPKYAAAWVNKGEILAKLNRREEAMACYNRAKRLVAT